MKNKTLLNIALVTVAVIIAVVPLVIVKGSEFAGADGLAENVVEESSPGYKPWIESFWAPPGGETESLLFALQAAIGAGVGGLVVGYYIGRKEGRKTVAPD